MGSVALEGFGGGGSDLNFKVVSFDAEEELFAASPKENTIGVITSDPINGWTVNEKEPTEHLDRMIWISTGTYGTVEFNALKKNSVQIYPVNVRQYADGQWKVVDAYIYQGESWVEISGRVYLVENGIVNTDLTGDFSALAYGPSSSNASRKAPSVVKANNNIQIYHKTTGDASCSGSWFSKNAIDLSKFGKYRIHLIDTVGENHIRITIAKTVTDKYTEVAGFGLAGKTEGVYDIDISSLSGVYFVGISLYGNLDAATRGLWFDDLWLE